MIDRAVLAQCAAGDISPRIALSRLLLAGEAPDPEELAGIAAQQPESGALADMARLARRHRERLEGLSALARAGLDPADGDPIASAATLFDRLAEVAPEAAVAFYSFGDADDLAAMTSELVAVTRRWAPVEGRSVLDFGCGIGRVSAALAGEARSVLGVDISAKMIAEARRRVQGPTLRFEQVNGHDLAPVADSSIELLIAADSLPYLAKAGGEALIRFGTEARRVLQPGGDLLIFNWSYRGDIARDIAEARHLADTLGFEVLRAGERPFSVWDGLGFHLRRSA